MNEEYLFRTEDGASPLSFKLEHAEGTLEMYGHINSYGFIDYSFFLDQVDLDGGTYGGYWNTSEKYGNFDEEDMQSPNGPEQEWFFLVADILNSYDFKERKCLGLPKTCYLPTT